VDGDKRKAKIVFIALPMCHVPENIAPSSGKQKEKTALLASSVHSSPTSAIRRDP